MKKLMIVIPALAALSVGVFGLINLSKSSQPNAKRTIVTTAVASYMSFASLNDLEQASDIILIGRTREDFKDREHKITKYADGSIQDFYTLTKIEIDRVIKGDTSLRDLQIVEPVGMIVENNATHIMKFENYEPLEKNKQYIIYLKHNGIANYGVINMNNGKFETERLKIKNSNIEEGKVTKKLIGEIQSKYEF